MATDGPAHVPSYDIVTYLADRSNNAATGILVLAWLVACVPLSLWAIRTVRHTHKVPYLSGLSIIPAMAALQLAIPVFIVANVAVIGLWGFLTGLSAGLLTALIVYAAVVQWISEGVNPPLASARTAAKDSQPNDGSDFASHDSRLKLQT